MGHYLNLAERALAQKEYSSNRRTIVNDCVSEAVSVIPAGAILLAPRYDGGGRPLAAVPRCWCCQIPWRLERLSEWRGRAYAFLQPGCGCLDVPQALACCGLCVDHCRCKSQRKKPQEDKATVPVADPEDQGR